MSVFKSILILLIPGFLIYFTLLIGMNSSITEKVMSILYYIFNITFILWAINNFKEKMLIPISYAISVIFAILAVITISLFANSVGAPLGLMIIAIIITYITPLFIITFILVLVLKSLKIRN